MWEAVLWRSEEVKLSAKGSRAVCRVAGNGEEKAGDGDGTWL